MSRSHGSLGKIFERTRPNASKTRRGRGGESSSITFVVVHFTRQFDVGVKSQRCVIHPLARLSECRTCTSHVVPPSQFFFFQLDALGGMLSQLSSAIVTHPAAVPAAPGCVPRGQLALLDADMRKLIDRSACLVEPVVVERVLFSSLPCSCKPAPGTSSAASSRCSRMSPSRGLVEGLVLLRAAHSELLLSLHCDCTSHLGYSACLVIG